MLSATITFMIGCAATDGDSPALVTGPREVIGRSLEGRELVAHRLGGGPLRILVLAGIHGDESEGTTAMPELLAWLASDAAPGLATWLVMPDLNPDGAQRRQRTNARGVDLNRNWPARNFTPASSRGAHPLSEPEASATHECLRRFAPHIVISLHSSHGGPFVNFDGPAYGLAERFAAAAADVDPSWRVVASMGYPTPGSLGSFAGVDRGVPVLTIEFHRGDRDLGAVLRAGLSGMLEAVL